VKIGAAMSATVEGVLESGDVGHELVVEPRRRQAVGPYAMT